MAYALTVAYSPFSSQITFAYMVTKIFPGQIFPVYDIQFVCVLRGDFQATLHTLLLYISDGCYGLLV